MRISSGCRAALLALATAFGSFDLSSAAYAASGTIQFSVLKGGWFIGASGGAARCFFTDGATHCRSAD